MSRPVKQGLDYFPMDVNTDEKIELIEAKHGLIGFAILVKLFQKIYKNGYFLEWNDERLLLFKKNINVDINLINDVINDCFEYNILNRELFEKYKILSSTGIQKRYLNACERRKIIELTKTYIIVDINSINVNINWINEDISTQSKGKERKGKGRELPAPEFGKNLTVMTEKDLREIFNGEIQIDNWCMKTHSNKDQFVKFKNQWIENKVLTGDFHYQKERLKSFMLNDWEKEKKEIAKLPKSNTPKEWKPKFEYPENYGKVQ